MAAETAEPEPDEPGEVLAAAHPADMTEPAELIDMSEPVELAEPVEEIPPRRRGRGRGLLIGAVFFVLALAIIGGAFAIVGSLTHGFKKPVIITYKKSAIFSLRTGECIDPSGQQAATLVPCATAHKAEVFATFALPASKWPGETGVRTAASSGCASRLTRYLNPQLAISLATTYVYPDKVAWQQGTRTVICEVRATKGELTGSVRGATAS
jgi:nitrite reductase/ring-hydroxylating ferredoxin subunit